MNRNAVAREEIIKEGRSILEELGTRSEAYLWNPLFGRIFAQIIMDPERKLRIIGDFLQLDLSLIHLKGIAVPAAGDKPKEESKIERVFICGAYNADNIVDALNNIRLGIEAAVKLLLHGFSPFCPMLDFNLALVQGGRDLEIEHYRRYCHSWLRVSQVMIVLEGWKEGYHTGVEKEIEIAKEIGIPIYQGLAAFLIATTANTTKSSEGMFHTHRFA